LSDTGKTAIVSWIRTLITVNGGGKRQIKRVLLGLTPGSTLFVPSECGGGSFGKDLFDGHPNGGRNLPAVKNPISRRRNKQASNTCFLLHTMGCGFESRHQEKPQPVEVVVTGLRTLL